MYTVQADIELNLIFDVDRPKRAQCPYKFTELHYSNQIVNNSVKFKTYYSDITTY